ncbi:hypothetical protein MRY87_02110 [bacterium]|nr:hypothetical protein [bacterium]
MSWTKKEEPLLRRFLRQLFSSSQYSRASMRECSEREKANSYFQKKERSRLKARDFECFAPPHREHGAGIQENLEIITGLSPSEASAAKELALILREEEGEERGVSSTQYAMF